MIQFSRGLLPDNINNVSIAMIRIKNSCFLSGWNFLFSVIYIVDSLVIIYEKYLTNQNQETFGIIPFINSGPVPKDNDLSNKIYLDILACQIDYYLNQNLKWVKGNLTQAYRIRHHKYPGNPRVYFSDCSSKKIVLKWIPRSDFLTPIMYGFYMTKKLKDFIYR